MAEKTKKKNVRRFYGFAKAFVRTVLFFGRKKILKAFHAEVQPYTPKNDTFIIIGNHTDTMDPGYQIISLNRYIRFVSADFVVRLNCITKLLLGKMDGVIIKNRNKPSDVLISEIMENLKAGIPVGLHAEGLITTNGETGYISPNTGKLVKDSGVALITYRIVGGYLRKPRWAETGRNGPVYGKVVHEYSPEELKNYSVDEINEIIRRDIYVNAFEQQKMHPEFYEGKNLAEFVERTLYLCPKCKEIGTLHSHGDNFTCECGYSLTYGEDGLFHSDKNEVIFDNILSWDKWQRKEWHSILQCSDGLIFTEKNQIISKVYDGIPKEICRDGVLNLYKDKFELIINGKTVALPLNTLKRVQNSSKQNLVLINGDGDYYLVGSSVPRSSDKYVAAYYYLTDREYK